MPPMHTHRYVERLVDLLDPSLNRLHDIDLDEARRRVLSGDPAAVRAIDGSFAIVAKDGITIRMARSLDRPMRYFLAKRQEGPALFVADRIDTLHRALDAEGLAGQFHPSYTRMVPAHHVVEIQLVGCPDPDPIYTRFFTPERDALPADLDEIGRRYVGAASLEVAQVAEARRARDAGRADRRLLLRRRRQRLGVPARLPRDDRAGPVAVAAQGVRARRRRARCRAGARVPAGRRPRAVPGVDSRRRRPGSTPRRPWR